MSLDAQHPDLTRAEILDRRDIDLCAVDLPPRVYHAAKGLPRDAAQALIRHVTMSATRMAVDETGPDILSAPLDDVLSSHTRIHVAENALYREALATAATVRGFAGRDSSAAGRVGKARRHAVASTPQGCGPRRVARPGGSPNPVLTASCEPQADAATEAPPGSGNRGR